MRIVVTGSSGFIGNRVAVTAKLAGHDVIGMDVAEGEHTDVIKSVESLDAVTEVVAAADVVVHLAGPVLGSYRQRVAAGTSMQLGGTENIARVCSMAHVRMLLASSFYVYEGLPKAWTVDEETKLDPFIPEPFGGSKLAAEWVCHSYQRAYGLEYVAMRFGSAYGPGRCSNVVKTFLEKALADEPIDIWGDGTRVNQYTYVDDIADGVMLLADSHVEGPVNLVSPEQTTMQQLAEQVDMVAGLKWQLLPDKPPGGSFPMMWSNIAQSLGWQPHSLDLGLRRMKAELES